MLNRFGRDGTNGSLRIESAIALCSSLGMTEQFLDQILLLEETVAPILREKQEVKQKAEQAAKDNVTHGRRINRNRP